MDKKEKDKKRKQQDLQTNTYLQVSKLFGKLDYMKRLNQMGEKINNAFK